MCKSQSLIELLKNEFKDVTLEKNCINTARRALQQGMTTRIFDKFPAIISPDDLKIFIEECKNLLIDIDSESIVEKNNKFIFTEEDDKNRMFEWQLRIIEKGAAELLDQKANVKFEFITLLGLKNFKVAPNEMLCSYVGVINQYITHSFEKYSNHLIKNNSHVYNMIFYYVNKNYGNWIRLWLTIFEKIPEIIPSDDLQRYLKTLQNLSIQLNSKKYLSEQEKNEIYVLQKKIINSAMSNALNEEGHINREFIKTLGLKDFKILSRELITLYVSAINHYLIRIAELFPENKTSHLPIFDYINKHYTLWIEDELPHAGYVLVRSKNNDPLNWPMKNPSPGILLVLAAITTASAGYMFFKGMKEEKKPLDFKCDNKLTITI